VCTRASFDVPIHFNSMRASSDVLTELFFLSFLTPGLCCARDRDGRFLHLARPRGADDEAQATIAKFKYPSDSETMSLLKFQKRILKFQDPTYTFGALCFFLALSEPSFSRKTTISFREIVQCR